ncbi:hypothetical protein GCM10010289_59170 [Streptomyces violascens]|nr:hypothetical protein GCM10010289_59170 [Streptomyces violascens]
MQAFVLACGFLFVSLYKGFLGGVNSLLFGSFLGITTAQMTVLAVVGALALSVLACIGRPLLLASVDPDVAVARGVPVRALAVVFLVLLGAATAEASQITGILLVFGLLVMPAATAQQLAARPVPSLFLSVLIALGVTWAGLITAYYSPYPIGFYVTTFTFAAYAAARLGRMLTTAGRRRPLPGSAACAPSPTPTSYTPCWPARRSPWPPVSSGTSSCYAPRSSLATPSATSPSPVRSRRSRSATTFGSACSEQPCSSRS